MTIHVIKRDGSKELLDINKIHQVLSWACNGLDNVSISEIEMRSRIQFFDNMKTETIHNTLIRTAANLIDIDTPNYQYVAARLGIFQLRKKVFGQYETTSIYNLVKRNINRGVYDPNLLVFYTEEEYNELEKIIDHDRDFNFTYAAFKQLEDKYLVQNRITKDIYETPQYLYILCAATIFAKYEKNVRLKYVKEFYDAISLFNINLPTPILAGVRTNVRQYSSCVLVETDDSLDSINATTSIITKYASQRAGLGIGAGRIRAIGSPVKDGQIYHTGITPFYKLFQSALKSCCLRPDMYVQVNNGNSIDTIQIKDVTPGMKIKTLDNNNIVYRVITDKFNTIVKQQDQVRLVFENGVIINCSTNHPIMIYNKDNIIEQVYPLELTAEHNIISDCGTTKIVSIESNQSNDENYIDITVEDTHTFFTSSTTDGDMILTHNSQGSIRSSSATLYAPIWHKEIDTILSLKNNKGTEESRCRHIDYAIQINGFFYKKYINNEDIYLFCPNDVPDMYDAFFDNQQLFETLYNKYSKQAHIKKIKVSSREVFEKLFVERTDTSRYYIHNVDNANQQSGFDETKVRLRMSNLCCLTGDTLVEVKHDNKEFVTSLTSVIDLVNNNQHILIKSKDIKSDTIEYKPITNALLTKTNASVIKVTTTVGDLYATKDHPIYTKNRGYIFAEDLTNEDQLDSLYDKDNVSVISITTETHDYDVYDISVKDNNNFFANGILVHNCEIILPTKPLNNINDTDGVISLCILAAFNLGNVKQLSDMEKWADLIVRALDELIDYQEYPILAAELTAKKYRSLGVGVINYAYYLAKHGHKYTSSAYKLTHETFEAMQYYLLKASNNLAKEKGQCDGFKDTKFSKGLLPIDFYNQSINEYANFEYNYDWEELRVNIKQYGLRNCTLSALMPSESCQTIDTKIILGNGEIKSFKEIFNDAGFTDDILEKLPVGWYTFDTPIEVKTKDGISTSERFYYNGKSQVYNIELEDGKVYKMTGNHKLLVKRDNQEVWVKACNLMEDDDVVNINE